ncbi:MAG: PilN domain-containing protein [Candidatus Omnitrophota bacterium]
MNFVKSKILGMSITVYPNTIKIKDSVSGKNLSLPVENAVSSGGVINNPQKTGQDIKEFLKANGVLTKNVITGIWGSGVVLRLMRVPVFGPEEIKNLIKEESSKYMVFAGSRIVSDFHTIDEINENGERKLKILAVAANKTIINSYVETMKNAGLNLTAIDVSSLVLAGAVFLKDSELFKGIAIVAAREYNNATIFVFEKGEIRYLHKVDSLEMLDTEIESMTAYCKNEFDGSGSCQVVYSDIETAMAEQGTVLKDTALQKNLITVNLLPVEELKIVKFKNETSTFMKFLAVVTVGMMIYFFMLFFQAWNASRIAQNMQKGLEKPDASLNELISLEKMDAVYRQEKTYQQQMIKESGQENWYEISQEIKRTIPKSAYILSLISNDKGILLIKGEAAEQRIVFSFVRALKESKFFNDVNLEESKDKEIDAETAYAYFVIRCRIAETGDKNEN